MSNIVQKKIQALHAKKREILGMSPKKALDAILSAEHPAAVVHAFTEQDFHLLIHDIGIDDARPLLALAKDRQLDYIVDTEIWAADQIDFLETILLSANPDGVAVPCRRPTLPTTIPFISTSRITPIRMDPKPMMKNFANSWFGTCSTGWRPPITPCTAALSSRRSG